MTTQTPETTVVSVASFASLACLRMGVVRFLTKHVCCSTRWERGHAEVSTRTYPSTRLKCRNCCGERTVLHKRHWHGPHAFVCQNYRRPPRSSKKMTQLLDRYLHVLTLSSCVQPACNDGQVSISWARGQVLFRPREICLRSLQVQPRATLKCSNIVGI
jgi:hypothetical protein